VSGSLLRLLTWLSPAFPTGGFAWSHGLEWAVEAGDVRDEATLRAWLGAVAAQGAGRSDAILLRHAYRVRDVEALTEVAALAWAAAPGRERQAETLGQGTAFTLAAAPWPAPLLEALAARIGTAAIAHPVAVGALAAAQGIDEEDVAAGYLHGFVANLTSAGMRLIPLGQSAGLRVIAALEGVVLAVAAATRDAALEDVGGACLRADIAAMRHETQYTRLFRS